MDDVQYSGYEDYKWAVKLNRASLQLLGLWPKAEQKPREKLKCNLRVLIVFLMFTFGILFPYIQSLIRIYKDIELVIEHLLFILPVITCVIRLVFFWCKKEAMAPIINMIAKDWLKLKNMQERKIMIAWAQRARTVITCSYCLITISCFCIIILPAFGIPITNIGNTTAMNKMLPLQAYHIYNIIKRPQYELMYITHAIMLFFAAMTYTGIDNFLGLLVFHICGQMDILESHLMCLDKVKKFQKGIKYCVMNHIRLLSATAIIEDTYNTILLVLFLYFGILFAFYGFSVVSLIDEKNDRTVMRLVFFISNILNLFIHMILYCAVGEILVAQCNKIYCAIYNQEWYSLEPKKAKDLIFLMIKSSEPSYITAGKVFPMTMLSFCNLVKTSAGYISILLTTRS